MRTLARRSLVVLAPMLVFAALLRPIYAGESLAMRELFRLSMRLGLIEESGTYWGQIGGLSIPSHSEAFHLLVRFGALSLTLAPLMGACLLLWYQLRRAPVLGVRRWITLRRAALCALGSMVAFIFSEHVIEWYAQSLFFRAGKAAGCEYVAISVLWVGPDGPFTGGRWAGVFNPLYMHGPPALSRTLALLLAWGAFAVWSRRDPEPREGQCPACGYPRAGHGVCPECGLELRPAPGSGA